MNEAMTRFDGVFFSHDPKTLKITGETDVRSERLASGRLVTGNILKGAVKISGTGELYGEHYREDLDKLTDAYVSRRVSVLSVPYIGAVRAVLSQLTLSNEPSDGFVGVSFTFDLVHTDEKPEIRNAPYRIARENEDLWDIAYEEGVSINTLAALNPHIRYIDSLSEGERVRIY